MAAPPTGLGRGIFMLLIQLPPAIPSIWWAYSIGGLISHPIPLPSLHGREGSSFPGSAPPNGMVNSKSVVGVKPVITFIGDTSVVIQVSG